MDEFEKWLDEMFAANWDSQYEGVFRRVRDKYRSMTCKMEYVDGLYSAFKCSACGELCNEDCAEHPRYCPDCGRKVTQDG